MKLREPDPAPRFLVDSLPGMQARFRSAPAPLPLAEFRALVAVARRYLAGECTAGRVYEATTACLSWTNIYGAHPAIRALARDWAMLAEQVGGAERWVVQENGREWDVTTGAPLPPALPESALRARLLEDLGGAVSLP